MTPHNEAKKGDIAPYVLMPGDPLRAKYIADNFLEDVKQVNAVRNMLAYTGIYKGVKVTVMGGGMGIPSIGIYSYELFKFYDVEAIIRVGSAGAYDPNLNLFDVVLCNKAWGETTYPQVQSGDNDEYQYPQGNLNELLKETAKELNIKLHEGCVHSSDVFYAEDNMPGFKKVFDEHGCICVDMESVALFHNAKVLNKEAATVLTISDSLVHHQETTSEQREKSFTQMMELTLEMLVKKSK